MPPFKHFDFIICLEWARTLCPFFIILISLLSFSFNFISFLLHNMYLWLSTVSVCARVFIWVWCCHCFRVCFHVLSVFLCLPVCTFVCLFICWFFAHTVFGRMLFIFMVACRHVNFFVFVVILFALLLFSTPFTGKATPPSAATVLFVFWFFFVVFDFVWFAWMLSFDSALCFLKICSFVTQWF